ncbi:hypothetical protein EEL52_07950 [Muribaculaceae bacterium Isolate-113 (HZI)]|nr:hypothetical protein EEL53_09475 [Muribaculaceae bacterium Isolate-114 (HZI)]ROT21838.1 hypothetical protein EEL52_07950 [Muribaculaceae bacterium Isolate-113 (HZI)]
MKRIYLILTALSLSLSGLNAATLTPGEALSRLSSAKGPKKVSGRLDRMDVVHTLRTLNGNPSAYIFADRNAGGYLVVSADDCAAPLLGYSESGSFDSESLPPQFEYWLGEYSRQIEYASLAGLPAYDASPMSGVDGRKIVAPLISTRWNQDAPYNLLVPSKDSRNYPTGCVATAMAQVMKYWNYPERGTGSGSITLPSGAQGESSMNFRTAFDWDNMLDIYKSGGYDDTQAKAVATLMKACGYSTKMNYSMGGSGTLSRFAAQALVNNFSYNPDIECCERDYYSTTEWEGILYAEMAAGRPVLYGGVSSSVGHEFVCDGYAGDGYFHFNWGWGGMSDGYFLLAALDPGSVGIGGGTGSDGFNYAQDIIIGIQPGASYSYTPRMTQLGNLSATVSGKSVTMTLDYGGRQGYWVNTDIREIDVNFGVTIEPTLAGTQGGGALKLQSGAIAAPSLTPTDGGYQVRYAGYEGKVSFNIPDGLADGSYRVTVSSQQNGNPEALWLPVLKEQGCVNSFYITKSAGRYEVSTSLPSVVAVTGAEVVGKLYYGCASRLNVTVGNTSQEATIATLKPCLYSGDVCAMEGDAFEVSLSGGESRQVDLTTVFRILPGVAAPLRLTSYKLRFVDAETGEPQDWNASVRMYVNAAVSLGVNEFVAENATLTGDKEGDTTVPNVYEVSTGSSLMLKAVVENLGAYFGYGISAQVSPASDTGNVLATVKFGPDLFLAEKSETATITSTLSTDGIGGYDLYRVRLYAMAPNGFAEIKGAPEIYFRLSSSGVSEVDALGVGEVSFDRGSRKVFATGDVSGLDLYDISGSMIAAEPVADGERLSARVDDAMSGIVIAVARYRSGAVKTLKIVL